MQHKTILITGATSGIGRETAKQLAKTDATVVIVARNSGKGERAVREIQACSANKKISYLTADLSSQKEVRRLASDFTGRFHSLDVLINNAGMLSTGLKYSADGIEMQLAVNHLACFLLTNLLLGVLGKSPSARIVNVSSEANFRGEINFDDLNFTKNYDGIKAYRQSKLANVLFTYELAERLKGQTITANCLDPGGVNTNLGNAHANGFVYWAWLLAKPFFASIKKGAMTSVYLACSPEVEGVSGKYFERCEPKKSAPLSYDRRLAEKLWEVSEKMTGIGN